MGLRPGKCYRDKDGKAYTRMSERKPRKSYIKGVPGIKVKQFEFGNRDGDFEKKYYLEVKDDVQIRHNAIEAARINANKHLVEELGEENYFLKVLVYPHHVLRENPLATGAGADRFQKGMRQAFGNPVGKAARMDRDQRFMYIATDSENEKAAKEALNRAKHKLPSGCRVVEED